MLTGNTLRYKPACDLFFTKVKEELKKMFQKKTKYFFNFI